MPKAASLAPKKHSKEQLSEWGKKGGRPKGSGKKAAKKGGK